MDKGKPANRPPDALPGNDPAVAKPLLDAMLALGQLQAAEPPLHEFLDQACATIARATAIAHIKVLEYRPHLGDLLVVAGVGWNEGVVGQATLPIDITSPPGRAIQTGHASMVEDFAKQDEYKLSSLLQNHGIQSLLNVPIRVDGAIWGVLEADSEQPCHFSENLIEFFHTAAYLIGAVVQRYQRQIESEERRADITREVARREMLLAEIHHRVKNNFQVILSSLLIQRRRAQSEETRHVLQTMSNQVMAISIAHDQLDARQISQSVRAPLYFGALCRTITQVSDEVVLETDFDDGTLPIEDAVALGLILNELVTNALKHAFEGAGRLTVTFRAGLNEREGCLSVADNGKGMGEPARSGSSGITLVKALAAQLRGHVEYDTPGRGTVVRVHFPLRE